MKNIMIYRQKDNLNLDRKIKLNNGAIVIQKENGQEVAAYLVVSFRDGKNKYKGDRTSEYCTLINLDTGQFAFEERCSRNTTERRVLRHLTRSGYDYPYNPDSHAQDSKFSDMEIQVIDIEDYQMNLFIFTNQE